MLAEPELCQLLAVAYVTDLHTYEWDSEHAILIRKKEAHVINMERVHRDERQSKAALFMRARPSEGRNIAYIPVEEKKSLFLGTNVAFYHYSH